MLLRGPANRHRRPLPAKAARAATPALDWMGLADRSLLASGFGGVRRRLFPLSLSAGWGRGQTQRRQVEQIQRRSARVEQQRGSLFQKQFQAVERLEEVGQGRILLE